MSHRRREPRCLESMSFRSWLKALDSELGFPKQVPTKYLLQALSSETKLSESTIIKVVQALSLTEVRELDIAGEILNPTMLQQVARALITQPYYLEKLSLELSTRLHKNSSLILKGSFQNMKNLQSLTLMGGANDELLKALCQSNPPLVSLNLSNSKGITDEGVKYFLNYTPEDKISSPINNKKLHLEPKNKYTQRLQYLSIWNTSVTTRGCTWVLKVCHCLEVLSCQWTLEALLLLNLKNNKPTKLTNLLIWEDEITDAKFNAVTNLCPNLKLLTIRRAQVNDVTFNYVLNNFLSLENFSILEFTPSPTMSLHTYPYHENLRRLSLCSFYHGRFDISELQKSAPFLVHLTIEGLKPKIAESPEKILPFQHLNELRLNTAFSPDMYLDPDLIINIINKLTKKLVHLDLGHCKYFEDLHIASLLDRGSLEKIEDLRLSGAINISVDKIRSLIEVCPNLKTIVCKMIPREKLLELENFKLELRSRNVDIEIIAYGHIS